MQKSINRGEIYAVDWEPSRGHEQRGRRPALVIQNDAGNKSSPTTIVAACSTAPVHYSYPFIVRITPQESGLSAAGHVNLAQIMTIDKVRLLQKLGTLSKIKMAEVDMAIESSLGLRNYDRSGSDEGTVEQD